MYYIYNSLKLRWVITNHLSESKKKCDGGDHNLGIKKEKKMLLERTTFRDLKSFRFAPLLTRQFEFEMNWAKGRKTRAKA